MLRFLFVLILSLLPIQALSGPSGSPVPSPDGMESLTRNLVKQTLGAPDSAQFRRMKTFRLSDGGWAVCGEVNSNNLTGLRMGWKPFFVRFSYDGTRLSVARRIVDWPADVACAQLASGRQLRTWRN